MYLLGADYDVVGCDGDARHVVDAGSLVEVSR